MHRYICSIMLYAGVAIALLTPTAGAIPPSDWHGPPSPEAVWSPATNASYDYGWLAVGQAAGQTFTLTNIGDAATAGLALTLSGSAAFTITEDGCSGRSLGPQRLCTVSIRFAPLAAGSATATLTATSPQITSRLTLTGRSPTAGHIYWANRGAIGRADLGGQNANQSFIAASGGVGVAVDGGHVYWTDFNNGTIGRADLDGQNANANFITGASLPVGVAVDSRHVYWTNQGAGTIGRADLDGQNVDQSFITGASIPLGLAVDTGHLYWGNFIPGFGGSTIGRADLNGQNVNHDFITGVSWPAGVAVDSGYVYWASYNTNAIGRADLNGQNANQRFVAGAPGPLGVAVDSSSVYWTNFDDNTIGRADLAGQNVNQSFITGATGPYGVAVGSG